MTQILQSRYDDECGSLMIFYNKYVRPHNVKYFENSKAEKIYFLNKQHNSIKLISLYQFILDLLKLYTLRFKEFLCSSTFCFDTVFET